MNSQESKEACGQQNLRSEQADILDWPQPLLAPSVIKSTTHFHYGTLGFLNNQKDFEQTAQMCGVTRVCDSHISGTPSCKVIFTDYHKKYSASSLWRQLFKLLTANAEKSEDIHKQSCIRKYKVSNAVPGRYLHTER